MLNISSVASERTMSNGGISIHVKSGKEPADGYMVAFYGACTMWLRGDDVTDPARREAAIRTFMDKNEKLLSDPDNYLGTWFDTETGDISVDISKRFNNKEDALTYGRGHNAKAIWDVKNQRDIPT